ncbi:hypothetical protein [Blastococcus sp. TF02A-26]|uniref:hypothetical protein n=1 Tax=Blastococcus sp. TF02A-26 TaxID=2250577 RepID=UPI000DEA60C3|nr:hypothetical protein [Blastococcus sp. TF02A-26]RBY85919.1 hypothetical protein DQ240_11055 [Blastococcus sp. TF02A-26]
MRRLVVASALAAVVVLSGCGGGDDADRPSAASPTEECIGFGCSDEQDAELLEGEAEANEPAEVSVTDGPYEWPDGVTARIVSATAGPLEFGGPEPPDDTQVTIVVEFRNGGEAPFLFPDGTLYVADEVFYGENRYEAGAWAVADNNVPQQLVPGTSTTYTTVVAMPGSELGKLAFQTSPNSDTHPPVTFTDVETLL